MPNTTTLAALAADGKGSSSPAAASRALGGADAVRVAVRVRPFNARERGASASRCVVQMSGKATTVRDPNGSRPDRTFTFDHSLWSHDGYVADKNGYLSAAAAAAAATTTTTGTISANNASNPSEPPPYTDQRRLFELLGAPLVDNAFEGYNAALFAYGQTGAGKSYSMVGYGSNPGIIPMTVEALFARVAASSAQPDTQYQLSFSMLEVYNERVRDLLASGGTGGGGGASSAPRRRGPGGGDNNKRTTLNVREHPKTGFYVEGLRRVAVSNYKEVERLMAAGNRARVTASTTMNETSSRSHMVITLKFSQVFPDKAGKSTTKTSDVHLVDLAGSERADASRASGDRLREGSLINQSLSTLGNVIKALADRAAGRDRNGGAGGGGGNVGGISSSSNTLDSRVPYRNSVLTKLLKNALGGNSRTVMLAAISPSAACYGETVSTLRYADRAKRIQNRPVVNESPTDKLIRELREENARLMSVLKRGGLSAEDAAAARANNAYLGSELRDMEASWEARLQQARAEWEQQQAGRAAPTEPHLRNINEDPQLSGLVCHIVREGSTIVGRAQQRSKREDADRSGNGDDAGPATSTTTNSSAAAVSTPAPPDIALGGAGIQFQHAVLSRQGAVVTLEPAEGAQVVVNGKPFSAGDTVKLTHGDRVIFAASHMYIFVGAAAAKNGVVEDVDYETVRAEATGAHGLGGVLGLGGAAGDGTAAEMDRVRADLMQILPMVAEANAMSVEMGKGIKFEPHIRVSLRSGGRQRRRELCVRVTDVPNLYVWLWTKPKFINRKYLMQEVYQAWAEGQDIDADREKDPFWDPPEDYYLGSVFVILQPLAYCIDISETLTVTNSQGGDEGLLEVAVEPCTPEGTAPEGDMFVSKPDDLIGRRLDFRVRIVRARGVKWVQEDKTRGVVARYKFYTDPKERVTKAVKYTMNPDFNYAKQFTIRSVSESFLAFLESSELVVELWGRQGKGEAMMRQATTLVGSAVARHHRLLTARSRTRTTIIPLEDGPLQDHELDQTEAAGDWIREKRVLEKTIRGLQEEVQGLQQEVEMLGIEKGALERGTVAHSGGGGGGGGDADTLGGRGNKGQNGNGKFGAASAFSFPDEASSALGNKKAIGKNAATTRTSAATASSADTVDNAANTASSAAAIAAAAGSGDPAGVTAALRAALDLFLGNHRLQYSHVADLRASGVALEPADTENLELLCEQQAGEVSRIAKMMEDAVSELRLSVDALARRK